MLKIDSNLSAIHPGASLGLMLVKNVGGGNDRNLDGPAEDLLGRLKTRWEGMSRSELRNAYPLNVYAAYYKKFGQNYMVQHQLESVLSGKKTLTAPFPPDSYTHLRAHETDSYLGCRLLLE